MRFHCWLWLKVKTAYSVVGFVTKTNFRKLRSNSGAPWSNLKLVFNVGFLDVTTNMSNKVSATEFEVISILSKNECLLLSDLKAKIIERSIEKDQFWLSNIPRLEDFLRKRPDFFNVSRDPPLVSSKITTMEMLELDDSLVDEDLKHQYGRDELLSILQNMDGPTEFVKNALSHINRSSFRRPTLLASPTLIFEFRGRGGWPKKFRGGRKLRFFINFNAIFNF